MPLASLRIIDLARALAIEPDVLMLDEMTAALPANLTERVLEVIGRQRGGDRSVIFISHRMIEIAAVCDRATVLREGETVGVVDVTAGLRGADRRAHARPDRRRTCRRAPSATAAIAPGVRDRRRASRPATSAHGTKLNDVSFDLYPGEVLGVVALEGQGQDELFDILAGSERPSGGELLVDGTAVSFRHPADAIRAGLVYVAGRPRRGPADAALRPREHRAAVHGPAPPLGPRSTSARSGSVVDEAIDTLQIDTRARRRGPAAVGRQPAEGDDRPLGRRRRAHDALLRSRPAASTSGPSSQIYVLLRDLAEAGAAVLLYTSELKEIQLVCDRAIVIFGGSVVAEIDGGRRRRAGPAARRVQPAIGRADARGDRRRAIVAERGRGSDRGRDRVARRRVRPRRDRPSRPPPEGDR